MTVGGQSVPQAALAHQDEADGIAKRVALVLSPLQQRQRGPVKGIVDPHDLDIGVLEEPKREGQCVGPAQPPRLAQGDELGENVAVGEERWRRVD